MNARKTVKKILALGAGAVMVGATITGALAYDLANYPAPFIQNGVFAGGKIVVGQDAAVQDVLGSIDISASLQRSAVSKVAIPGQAGEVSLTGDAFRFETSSDLLEMRETLGEVYDTLTVSELKALAGGEITTDEGSTDYSQYVRFGDGSDSTSTLANMSVNYAEDENDVLGDFLIVGTDSPFFEWEIEFSEGLESEIDTTNDELPDLEDEVFNIFGTEYTFVDSTYPGSEDITLEFMAGDVSSTMREGETKTFTIDGVEYEISLIFVSDPNDGSAEAKFMVNGEVTDSLTDGDTDSLSGGVQIGVRDLLVNSREGVVEFFLGAEKVGFTDTDYTSATLSSGEYAGTVEIGNENIEDGSVAIVGNELSSTTFEITSIKYRLVADASEGSTLFVPKGHGVREYLDEADGMLSPTFDIQYEGLKTVKTTDVDVNANGDDAYELTLTNLRGKEYKFPLVDNSGASFFWGSDDDRLWFTEPTVAIGGGSYDLNISDSTDFWIGDDDYFVVSEGYDTGVTATEKDDSAVLRYDDIDTSDRIIYFTDVSNGEQKSVSYTAYTGANAANLLGTADNFVVEGGTYKVWVANTTGYPLAIALNGDSALDGERVTFTVKGGGILAFDAIDQTDGTPAGSINMSLTTVASNFDDGSTGDSVWWNVSDAGSNEVDLDLDEGNYVGPNEGAGVWRAYDQINDEKSDDYDRAITDYGATIEYYTPSDSNTANELTIKYPEAQTGAQVFIVAGTTTRSESSGGGSADQVNPIAVGLAVLDTAAPAVGTANMIVVGGPCANVVSAKLMGNPAQCGAGFMAGKAMIKSFEQGGKVAILVAGYEALETQVASRVLANYGDEKLSGAEVEIVVSSMSDYSVMKVA